MILLVFWKSCSPEKVFIISFFNRCDHCNHAEGGISAWMPPEPHSVSSCMWNILNINTSVPMFFILLYYTGNIKLVDFQQEHKRLARSDSGSDSNSDSDSNEVNTFSILYSTLNWRSVTVKFLRSCSDIFDYKCFEFSWSVQPPSSRRLPRLLQLLPLQLQLRQSKIWSLTTDQ